MPRRAHLYRTRKVDRGPPILGQPEISRGRRTPLHLDWAGACPRRNIPYASARGARAAATAERTGTRPGHTRPDRGPDRRPARPRRGESRLSVDSLDSDTRDCAQPNFFLREPHLRLYGTILFSVSIRFLACLLCAKRRHAYILHISVSTFAAASSLCTRRRGPRDTEDRARASREEISAHMHPQHHTTLTNSCRIHPLAESRRTHAHHLLRLHHSNLSVLRSAPPSERGYARESHGES